MSAPEGRRSDVVHARLRAQVLGGALRPGDAVPSERVLAEELGVNRHAVREALKRLEQAGLVTITQGGATRVRDWHQSAGLEVLLDLATGADGPPPELVRAVLEMRASIGVDAARRCAERAAPEPRERIAASAERTAELVDAAARAATQAAALELDAAYAELWEMIVLGAENIAYRLSLTSLVQALDAHPEVAEITRARDPQSVRALGAAILAGEAETAGTVARGLLEPDARALA